MCATDGKRRQIVLVTGTSGFLGSHVAAALEQAGHEVIACVRKREHCTRMAGRRCLVMDFAAMPSTEQWQPHLQDIDAVVNAVGLFHATSPRAFQVLHDEAPRALFSACAALGVKVVQLSALGATLSAPTEYFRSKARADEFLLRSGAAAIIVQPSLVFGPDGTSAALFAMLASMPAIPLPGKGEQRIQPIHVDDFADAIVAAVERPDCRGRRISLVGPKPITLRAYLAALRGAMGFGKARFVPIPLGLVRVFARFCEGMRLSLLSRDALTMLEAGSTADAGATRSLLAREPMQMPSLVSSSAAAAMRRKALLAWTIPLVRFSVALVWLWSAAVSFGIFPVGDSYALLARTGLTGAAASVALFGAASLDLAFGVGALVLRARRRLWELQAITIVSYTAIITAALPEFWLHPFGPIVKNLPMLAAIWLLRELDR